MKSKAKNIPLQGEDTPCRASGDLIPGANAEINMLTVAPHARICDLCRDTCAGVLVPGPDPAAAVGGRGLRFHPHVGQRDDDVAVRMLVAAGSVGTFLLVNGAFAVAAITPLVTR